MPRHIHARRGEQLSSVVSLVQLDAEGRVRVSAQVWGGKANAHVRLSIATAYELGRELVDVAESALMRESWREAARLSGDRLPDGRATQEPRPAAIRPARPVESRA